MALVDVIKWESNSNELVHKFQVEDLKLGSQLVVYQSQTAFFVKGGQILDAFSSGTYTIGSENIPLLNKLLNIPFGGNSPFQAEVWFVNQTSRLDCKWGTATPIQIEDPEYKVIVPLRSYGQYGFRINDPRLFLERLTGNMPTFATSTVTDYFRGVILSKLTAIVSQKLYADKLSVVNINSHVEAISEYAADKLNKIFAEYGLALEMFTVIAINVDDNDPSFRRLKETKDSLARITIMGKDNYRMERSFNVLDSAAENEGGGVIGAAVGLGAGVGVGTQIGSMVNEYVNTNPANTPPTLPVKQYYVGINGEAKGPYDIAEIKASIANRSIDENTLIWYRGINWTKAGELAELADVFNNCPPPMPTL